VYAPAVVTQDVDVSLTVTEGIDTAQLILDVDDAIVAYVNNLGVGADIILNEIIHAVMSVYGVSDCSVTDPTGNVAIATSQVGRTGVITVVTA
jgi:uncharacterized phage protein gp47/JayE